MIEFKPSDRDVLDALKLRILQDDKYVLECLKNCGLEKTLLENEAAKEYILEDLRANFKPIMKKNFDVTDSFKRFVNGLGYYYRHSPYTSKFQTLQIQFDPTKGGFEVYKFRESDSRDVTIVEYTKEEFNADGFEMQRSYQCHYTYAGGRTEKTTEISTRQEDMVTIHTIVYDTEGKIVGEKDAIVSPGHDNARKLDAYFDLSNISKEEIPTIVKFVKWDSYPPKKKESDSPEKKEEHPPKEQGDDGVEEGLNLPDNDGGIDMDDDDGLEM